MVFVVDAYINYVLQGNNNYPNVNYNEYDSIEKITKYLEEVESRANANLSKMTPEELAKLRTKDGEITVRMLLDFFQEETHHRGELLGVVMANGC